MVGYFEKCIVICYGLGFKTLNVSGETLLLLLPETVFTSRILLLSSVAFELAYLIN